MKNLLLALVLTFLIGCRNITPEQKLSNIIETYQNFQQNSDSNYPLGDYSESKFEKRAFFCDSLLTQLQALNPNTLKEDDKISYELLEFVLNEVVIKYKFKTHWNPILSDAGFHSSLTYQVRPITTKKDALKYLEKLKAIPLYIQQQTELIRKGLDAGMGQPLIIFKGYESTYEQHITATAEENFYYSTFLKLPTQLSEEEIDSIQIAAKEVILENVIPSFKFIKTFFEDEYYPNTRK